MTCVRAGYVQKYMDGELKVDEFISHKFGLDKINDAFHVMHEVRQLWRSWSAAAAAARY